MPSNRTIAIIFVAACTVGILVAAAGVIMMAALAQDRSSSFGTFPYFGIPFILSGFLLFVGYIRAIDAPPTAGKRLWIWTIVYNAICALFSGPLFFAGASSNFGLPFVWNVAAIVLAITALRQIRSATAEADAAAIVDIEPAPAAAAEESEEEAYPSPANHIPSVRGSVTAIVAGWLVMEACGRLLFLLSGYLDGEYGRVFGGLLQACAAGTAISAGYLTGAIARHREVPHGLTLGAIYVATMLPTLLLSPVIPMEHPIAVVVEGFVGAALGGYLRMRQRMAVEGTTAIG